MVGQIPGGAQLGRRGKRPRPAGQRRESGTSDRVPSPGAPDAPGAFVHQRRGGIYESEENHGTAAVRSDRRGRLFATGGTEGTAKAGAAEVKLTILADPGVVDPVMNWIYEVGHNQWMPLVRYDYAKNVVIPAGRRFLDRVRGRPGLDLQDPAELEVVRRAAGHGEGLRVRLPAARESRERRAARELPVHREERRSGDSGQASPHGARREGPGQHHLPGHAERARGPGS